jgi:hypothetical protein
MDKNYTNMPSDEWAKWFKQFERTSFEEDGKVHIYANQMEEIFQMFKARMKWEEENNSADEPAIVHKLVTKF